MVFNLKLDFQGVYKISMAASLLFLLVMLFFEAAVWYMVLLFGLILVYYDMDFVKRVKDSGAGFRLMGYVALSSLVFMGLGIFSLYFLIPGILIAGPGFYYYRRNSAMAVEYGRRKIGA